MTLHERMPLASKTTLRALENNYLDQSPCFAFPPRAFACGGWRSRAIDPAIVQNTRCHSCNNQIVKDQKQSSLTADRSTATFVCQTTESRSYARAWCQAEPLPFGRSCRWAGAASREWCFSTLVEERGRWPPLILTSELCSPCCFPPERFRWVGNR